MKKTKVIAMAIGFPVMALVIVLGVLAKTPTRAATDSFEILWVDLGLDHTRWALDRLGLTYTQVAVGNFGSVNLSDYDVLFVGSTSGSVPDDVFQPLLDRKADIAAFIQAGGGLVALSNGGDWGSYNTSLDWAWVPITLTIGSRTYRPHIISPTHSLVEGPTDASFFHWWGAHGEAFEAWEWPEATSVVQASQEGHSALLAGSYGAGRMVLTGMFPDWDYGDPVLEVLLKWAAGVLPDTPPQIARAYPDPSGWAATNTRLRLTFDQLIDPTTVTDGVLTVVADSGPVAGTLNFLPDIAHIFFTPATPLTPGEEVTATLAATVADWNSNPLDGNGDGTGGDAYTWHFTVRAGAILTVTSSDDNGPGTLRQALEDALPGDIITFDPAVFSLSAPVTITWQGGLPVLDDGYVTLDASDAGVFLDGSQASEWNGLNVTSDGNVIRGLTLANVEGACLFLKEGAAFNIIGGDRTLGTGPNGQGNTIGHCREPGIAVQHGGTVSNTFLGNYLGTDPTGTIAWPTGEGWGAGIFTGEGADYTTIGSNVPGERNLLSGNARDGLQIEGSYYATVLNNYLGTDASGTAALPNQDCGLDLEIGSRYSRFEGNVFSGNDYCGAQTDDPGTGYNEFIGNYFGVNAAGTNPLPNGWHGLVFFDNVKQTLIEDNIFAGGNGYGVAMFDYNSSNVFRKNFIGTNPTETADWGYQYAGIHIYGYQNGRSDTASYDNLIENNVIAHNGVGVSIRRWGDAQVEGNTISHNSIYSNTDKGIDLIGGANNYMFPPVFTEVSSTTVKGIAVPGSTVEVFSDNEDEGRWFHGSTTADATGHFTFTATSPFTGTDVTATATDVEGNTSEFTSPYAPNRDVLIAAVYVPQPRQKLNESLTPLVRVGNGGTIPETFTTTVVITHAGARVYEDRQTVTDLEVMQYRTLDFIAWAPTTVGDYTFEITVQPTPPDDDPANDRLAVDFQVVDARYDLWSRDNPTDDGREPSVGLVWQSPDIWVRNAADGLTEHQDPINNITNTVYVRVRNRGTLTATDATVTVYWHPPALVIGQSWWESIGTAVVGEVTPGAVHTVEMDWQPQITGILTEPYHTCLIDVISSTQDPAPLQWDVRGSNNIEQRNIEIISPTTTTSLHSASNTAISTTFSVGNPYVGEQLVDVIVDATGVPAGSEVRLDLGELFGRWQRFGQGSLTGAVVISSTTQVKLSSEQAVINGLPLMGEELFEVTLEVSGLRGRQGQIDVSERIGGEVLGGVSLQIVGRLEIFLPVVLRQ